MIYQQMMQAPPGTGSDTQLAGRGPLDKVAGPAPANTLRDQGAVTKTPIEASQGIKLGVMRWVLGISLALAIVALAIAYLVVR